MRAFMVVWVGQLLSLLGTGMTRFAITLWAWDLTGQATALTLVALFSFAPTILLSPLAGALVDRWDRKLVMMLSDLGAGLATIFMFIMALTGNLQIWHLYAAGAFAGAFEAFQFPAYSAAISTMVDKKHYARTSALLGLANSASSIAAPVLGVALYVLIGLQGVLLIDIVTFLFAIGALLLVHIPNPDVSEDGASSRGSLWSESLYGFRYILKRRSLFGLQMVFFFGNLLAGMVLVLIAPMILARTNDSEATLATVQAAIGIGGVAGGVLMSTWGGPKRRINGVLFGWLLISLTSMMVMGVGQALLVWVVGGFMSTFSIPLINASNQAIWQSKVPPDVQGRVFSVRRMIAQITSPLAFAVAGPLADFVFEPAMQPGGALAPIFGGLVGVGDGAGMGLMFVFAGLLCSLVGIVGYSLPFIRNVEQIIPDHQEVAPATPDSTEPPPPEVQPA
jgi:MFS family permease